MYAHAIPSHLVILTSHVVHLERLGSLPEETVRFYVAEVASALAFLHQSRIMHRFVRSVPCWFLRLISSVLVT